MKISVFKNTFDPTPVCEKPIDDILAEIKNGTYRKQIDHLRKIRENDQEGYKKSKAKLKAVSFSGTFTRRTKENLKRHSGIIVCDIDNLGEKLPDIRGVIDEDPHVAFSFVSPSGYGIKAGIAFDGEIPDDTAHKRCWRHAEQYFKEVFGIDIDPSGKDINRLCYLSDDPDLYINKEARPFPVPPAPPKQETPPEETEQSAPGNILDQLEPRRLGIQALETAVKMIEASTPGNRHDARRRAAYLVGGYITGGMVKKSTALAVFEKVVKENTDDFEKAMKTVQDCLEKGQQEPITLENLERQRQEYIMELKRQNHNDLEDIDIQQWPVLGDDALDGFAGEFVELATRGSEADPAAVLMTFLCRFAIEVGTDPFLYVGDTKHRCRLFSVIVGASSKARKGTSGKPIHRLFKDIEFDPVQDPARVSPGPLSSGEGLIYAVRDATTEYKTDKRTGRGEHVVTDPGVTDKRLFILDEEFGSALSCTKREGNTLSTIIRGAWDSGTLDPLTKTSKIKATDAHIGIVTHVTMEELASKLNETEAFNGFANRFLWCCARRTRLIPFPEPMPDNEFLPMKRELERILKKATRTGRMQFNEDAKKLWGEVYPELSKDHSGLVGVVINRGEAQVIRLSMVYALLDKQSEIGAEHLNRALAVWNYCQDSARFIFTGRNTSSIGKKILDALEDGPKTATELFNVFSRNIKKNQLEKAIQELIAQNKIEIETPKKEGRGRPKTLFRINDRRINSF